MEKSFNRREKDVDQSRMLSPLASQIISVARGNNLFSHLLSFYFHQDKLVAEASP